MRENVSIIEELSGGNIEILFNPDVFDFYVLCFDLCVLNFKFYVLCSDFPILECDLCDK